MYDVIVVGGGHAGCEAAIAAARMGRNVLLITFSKEFIATMPCNPSIGGIGKGHLVREIDALGGIMGEVADKTAIQFRMLNTKKGPSVQAPRCQSDKKKYSEFMKNLCVETKGIEIVEDCVDEIIVENNKIKGVKTSKDDIYYGKTVIIATGTFLSGLIHIGLKSFSAGRLNEPAAEKLSKSLKENGLNIGRLKTGTPPRIHKDSIDFSKTQVQDGDLEVLGFSHKTGLLKGPWVPCWITHTTSKTHEIIKKNLNRSPLYGPCKVIKGTGARYCPSLEDKVVRFPDRESHHVFLEPEGLDSDEIYVNGISNSLPEDCQEEFIRTIPGLENCKILKYGYGIEYDFVYPDQIKQNYEVKKISGLFLAGQINGTSGYEEAAAQGLMAGINAALKVSNEPPVILKRSEAYIGVITDDLTTKDINEPYRIFTSRAEYRLLLRFDNADERLMPIGRRLNLISEETFEKMKEKYNILEKFKIFLEKKQVPYDIRKRFSESAKPMNFIEFLRMPGIRINDTVSYIPEIEKLSFDIKNSLEIRIKYEGYIKKQEEEIKRLMEEENTQIPEDFDYDSILHLSFEAKEKLKLKKPSTLGQAYRITGVRDGDRLLLALALKRKKKVK